MTSLQPPFSPWWCICDSGSCRRKDSCSRARPWCPQELCCTPLVCLTNEPAWEENNRHGAGRNYTVQHGTREIRQPVAKTHTERLAWCLRHTWHNVILKRIVYELVNDQKLQDPAQKNAKNSLLYCSFWVVPSGRLGWVKARRHVFSIQDFSLLFNLTEFQTLMKNPCRRLLYITESSGWMWGLTHDLKTILLHLQSPPVSGTGTCNESQYLFI